MDGRRRGIELAFEQLRRATEPASLGFATTRDAPPLDRLIGQERAQGAIELALGMRNPDYNVYLAGHLGVGRRTAAMQLAQRFAATRATPSDWCYVCNFARPQQPRALSLPAGTGPRFAEDVAAYMRGVPAILRRVLASAAYRDASVALGEQYGEQHNAVMRRIAETAAAHGFGLLQVDDRASMRPLRPDVAVAGLVWDDDGTLDAAYFLTADDLDGLDSETLSAMATRRRALDDLLIPLHEQLAAVSSDHVAGLRDLAAAHTAKALDAVMQPLIDAYAHAPSVVAHLAEMARDLAARAGELRRALEPESVEDGADAASPSDLASAIATSLPSEPRALTIALEELAISGRVSPARLAVIQRLMRRYRVNVLVTHPAGEPAPVVQLAELTSEDVIGRIDVTLSGGAARADHIAIRAGALHRANGGFLIIHEDDLPSEDNGFVPLLRALRAGQVAPASVHVANGEVEPQPIALDVRIMLVGSRADWRMLTRIQPEFAKLFKVRADFADDFARTPEIERAVASYIAGEARGMGQELSAAAVARVIDEASRWSERSDRLTAQLGRVHDLIAEACHFAREQSATVVDAPHVMRAIAARDERAGLLGEIERRRIIEHVITIDTDGAVVGQINGLVVLNDGVYATGVPSRITARVAPGELGVVHIEREVARSSPSHSKGVLELESYLRATFAQEFPLSLVATLTFEEELAPIDGPSASCGELCALLSSLAGVPVRQSLAVTGWVNQLGEVQIIGGVNEKIEGFFAVCRERGLTGGQGVLIPVANVPDLMLREDVVEAVRAGQFHIYAVPTIEAAIEVLTGVGAGYRQSDGSYPAGTIYNAVQQRLRSYAARVQAFHTMAPVTERRGR